ncbi:MAG: hypothetical protein ABR601_02745, partial [Parasphingopyxis sp.]
MTVWFFRLVAAVLLVSLPIAAAHADWYRAETENFIIHADATEEVVTEYARHLERFDAVLRHFTGTDPEPADIKFRIYLVPDLGRLQRRMGGGGTIGGIYIPDMRGPYAAAPIYGYQTVLHEYVHHFMLHHAPAAYPRWYREGFAEFFSTVSFDDEGHADLGRFPFGRADDLVYSRRFSFEDLLREDENTNHFALYVQGWILVHHSVFHQRTGRLLAEYLQLMNRGQTGEQAFQATFASLGDELDDMLKDYGRGRMPMSRTTRTFEVSGEIAIRKLSEEEATVEALYPRRRDYLEREMLSAVRNYPRNAQVHAELAQLRLAQDRLDEALAAADAALAIDPDHVEANVFKGTALLRRADASGDPADSRWAEARELFLRANRADPYYPLALLRYYQSFPDRNARPDNAIAALEQAYFFVPQNRETRLQLAYELLRAGRFEEARLLALPM